MNKITLSAKQVENINVEVPESDIIGEAYKILERAFRQHTDIYLEINKGRPELKNKDCTWVSVVKGNIVLNGESECYHSGRTYGEESFVLKKASEDEQKIYEAIRTLKRFQCATGTLIS